MTIMSNFMKCSIVKMTLRHWKTRRIKLTLTSGILCWDWKTNFEFFVILATNKLIYKWLYFFSLQRTDQTNIFVQLSLDIIFHAIECGMATFPGYGLWLRLRGKLSQVTFPYKLFINNYIFTIERNLILFNGSQGFTRNFANMNIKREKYKNLQTKSVSTSPVLL